MSIACQCQARPVSEPQKFDLPERDQYRVTAWELPKPEIANYADALALNDLSATFTMIAIRALPSLPVLHMDQNPDYLVRLGSPCLVEYMMSCELHSFLVAVRTPASPSIAIQASSETRNALRPFDRCAGRAIRVVLGRSRSQNHRQDPLILVDGRDPLRYTRW